MNSKNHMFPSTIDSQSSSSDRKTSLNLTCLYFFFRLFCGAFFESRICQFPEREAEQLIIGPLQVFIKKVIEKSFNIVLSNNNIIDVQMFTILVNTIVNLLSVGRCPHIGDCY